MSPVIHSMGQPVMVDMQSDTATVHAASGHTLTPVTLSLSFDESPDHRTRSELRGTLNDFIQIDFDNLSHA
jgi:hypothetical protein